MKPQKLTKEQAYEAGAEMWNIIAENGYKYKKQALCDYTYEINFPEAKCFACEVHINNCFECLFEQYSEKKGDIIRQGCVVGISPYAKWVDTQLNNPKLRKQYAIEIAQLFIDALNQGE